MSKKAFKKIMQTKHVDAVPTRTVVDPKTGEKHEYFNLYYYG